MGRQGANYMSKTGLLLAHRGVPETSQALKIFFVLYDEKTYPVHRQGQF